LHKDDIKDNLIVRNIGKTKQSPKKKKRRLNNRKGKTHI